MKKGYWYASGAMVAIAAAVGSAVAIVHRPNQEVASVGSTPLVVVSPSPSPSIESPTASPSPLAVAASPSPAVTPASPAPVPTPEKLSETSQVTIYGLGPVRVGMTVDEASRAAGVPLVSNGDSVSPDCTYYQPAGGPGGVGFMVTDGKIARVDIWRESGIKTRSGLGNGSTKEQIERLFPGQIQEEPHEYIDGQYLIFVPRDKADQNYRIVFETNNQGRVLQYRAGKFPEVVWVEGCA